MGQDLMEQPLMGQSHEEQILWYTLIWDDLLWDDSSDGCMGKVDTSRNSGQRLYRSRRPGVHSVACRCRVQGRRGAAFRCRIGQRGATLSK